VRAHPEVLRSYFGDLGTAVPSAPATVGAPENATSPDDEVRDG